MAMKRALWTRFLEEFVGWGAPRSETLLLALLLCLALTLSLHSVLISLLSGPLPDSGVSIFRLAISADFGVIGLPWCEDLRFIGSL
jgi:hypothetical protein